jgi:hypothetical protein
MTVFIGTLALMMMALPSAANGGEVTRGEFETFGPGLDAGYVVTGHAVMVRTAGKTVVTVVADGLLAGQSYGSHVHNQPCGQGLAGGHYSFGHAVSGGALDGSEIWPGPFTANVSGRVHGMTSVQEKAGPTAVSVVIHAPGGQKIACADLG